jgi:erythromycin esterase
MFAFPLLVLAQQNLAYNKGFELTQPQDKLWAFVTDMKKCNMRFASQQKRSGKYSLEISSADDKCTADRDAPVFVMDIPGAFAKGKKQIKVEGWVKTEANTSRAGIFVMQFNGKSLISSPFTAATADSTKSSKEWQRVSVTVQVVENTESIFFGGLLNGAGKAWFDDFTLYQDGVPVRDVAKPTAEPTAQEITWINKNAVPLNGVAIHKNNRDLDSLSKWIGNAKVIGVGEPTHGTSEAAQFRLRLFQYLVENKGFTTLMMEDKLPECGRINQYILGSNDSARSILNLLFRINRTQEMLDVIEWMRAYNKTHDKKVYFRGNDMQSIRVAVPEYVRLSTYFDTALVSYSNELAFMTKPFMNATNSSQGPLVAHELKTLLQKMDQHIEKNKKGYYQKLPADTVNWLLQNKAVLNQYLLSHDFSDWNLSSVFRDSSMATNTVDYLQLYPDEKILLWAHNFHIWKQENKTMGGWLDRLLGDKYYALGIATAKGTYTAQSDMSTTNSYQVFPLFPAFAGSMEYYLQQSRHEDLILSLHNGGKSTNRMWFLKPLYFRNIGLGYIKEDGQFLNGYKPVLPKLLNAIVFIRNTTATKSFQFSN